MDRGKRRRRFTVAIASPFAFLIVLALGVVALPCETMKVVLTNESDTWARVRVGVHFPTRDLWVGDLAAGETRTLSLAAIPMGQYVDAFVLFPEVGSERVDWSEELFMAGYPLGIGIYRFRFAPGRIRGETEFDWWADRFESKTMKDFSYLFEFLFIALRCADCEVAALFRR